QFTLLLKFQISELLLFQGVRLFSVVNYEQFIQVYFFSKFQVNNYFYQNSNSFLLYIKGELSVFVLIQLSLCFCDSYSCMYLFIIMSIAYMLQASNSLSQKHKQHFISIVSIFFPYYACYFFTLPSPLNTLTAIHSKQKL
ncbi:hypothetical protein IMG5_165420, partial [Ichthyophthirius multifiliis]